MTLPFYKPLYFWHETEVGLVAESTSVLALC